MNILFLTQENNSLGLQDRLMSEEHSVRVWIKDPKARHIGEGIVQIIESYESSLPWADIVVSDCTEVDHLLEPLRQKNKPCVGGTLLSKKLEDDRVFGMKEMEKHGLRVPPWAGPFTIEQALTFVKKHPERYVFKPSGQKDREYTYASKDADDLINELTQWKSKGVAIGTGILQLFIEGKEVAVGTTICHGTAVSPYQINFEHKKLFDGERGPNTGEMGTIAYYTKNAPLIKEFQKFEPWFEDSDYATDFDLNFIVTEDSAYVLEPTCRFGYPAILLQAEAQTQDFGAYLSDLAFGALESLPVKSPWVCGVVACVPGFPFEESYKKHGEGKIFPLEGDLTPYELSYDHQKNEYVAPRGGYGAAAVSIGLGDSLDEARKASYEKLDSLPKEFFFRTDIGEKVKKDWDLYKRWIQ